MVWDGIFQGCKHQVPAELAADKGVLDEKHLEDIARCARQ